MVKPIIDNVDSQADIITDYFSTYKTLKKYFENTYQKYSANGENFEKLQIVIMNLIIVSPSLILTFIK